jgi:hypothetical protein
MAPARLRDARWVSELQRPGWLKFLDAQVRNEENEWITVTFHGGPHGGSHTIVPDPCASMQSMCTLWGACALAGVPYFVRADGSSRLGSTEYVGAVLSWKRQGVTDSVPI